MSLSLQILLRWTATLSQNPWSDTCVCVCVGHYNLYRFLGITPDTHMVRACTHTHTHTYTHTPTPIYLKGGGIDFTQKAAIQSYLLDLPSANALPTSWRCLWPGWPRCHFSSFVFVRTYLHFLLCLFACLLPVSPLLSSSLPLCF